MVFGYHLPVQHAELFEGFVVGVYAEADDLHEDSGHGFASEHGHDGCFECMAFDLCGRGVGKDSVAVREGQLHHVHNSRSSAQNDAESEMVTPTPSHPNQLKYQMN